jgi:DNA-binding transcriptional regulator YhcF (GntR family)
LSQFEILFLPKVSAREEDWAILTRKIVPGTVIESTGLKQNDFVWNNLLQSLNTELDDSATDLQFGDSNSASLVFTGNALSVSSTSVATGTTLSEEEPVRAPSSESAPVEQPPKEVLPTTEKASAASEEKVLDKTSQPAESTTPKEQQNSEPVFTASADEILMADLSGALQGSLLSAPVSQPKVNAVSAPEGIYGGSLPDLNQTAELPDVKEKAPDIIIPPALPDRQENSLEENVILTTDQDKTITVEEESSSEIKKAAEELVNSINRLPENSFENSTLKSSGSATEDQSVDVNTPTIAASG